MIWKSSQQVCAYLQMETQTEQFFGTWVWLSSFENGVIMHWLCVAVKM